MGSRVSALVARARTPTGRKAFRYAVVSAISVAVNQVVLFGLFAVAHWTARASNFGAFVVAGIPSYILNRRWTWGKTGRSHVLKELVPYWGLAFLGLACSTLAVSLAEDWGRRLSDSRTVQGMVVSAASIGAFGVLWIAKFVIFNKVIFVKDDDLRAALADEVVA